MSDTKNLTKRYNHTSNDMKQFLLILVLSQMCGFCHAQGFFDHIVQRGETLKFLASKFGVSEQDIREQNEDFDLDVLYAGLPLQIPIPEFGDSPEEIERLIASKSATSSILNEANLFYDNGSYRKAAKLYTAAIKEKATSDTYYLRGRCYLYQGKYKSAIEDLEMANTGGDLSYSLRSSCESLLAEAYDKRDTQLEARGELLGSIFAVAAVAATTVATVNATENQDFTRPTSSTYVSSQGYNLPPELQPEIAARNAVAQSNYQMKIEEENFKADYRATFKRNWGREPSDMEVTEAYTEYLKVKNEAYAAANSSSSSSTSSTISTSSTNSSTKTVSNKGKTCMKISATDDAHCNGMKVCSKCNGKKAYWDYSFGNKRYVDPCVVCGGSGKCPSCGGTGVRY